MRSSQDSNFLIGVLALQMGLVSRDQMIGAFREWVRDKSDSVDQMLVSSRAIDEETRKLILALVDKHIQLNDGDVDKTLSTLQPLEDSLIREIGSLDNSLFEMGLSCVESKAVNLTKAADRGNPQKDGRRSYLSSDRFMVLRPHARGGLGKVSVALDRELNREVALKEILEEQADQKVSRERFILEAEITGGLEHPGIIPVYALGTYDDGQPYYAMRFIRGTSLKEATKQWHQSTHSKPDFQALEFRRLIGRLIDVCNAMEYAHSRGVLHRDLKPSNIMLGKFGETMVVDWGLAKAVGRSGSSLGMDEPTLRPSSGSGVRNTMMGQALGTPAFMSPEQAAGQIDKLQPASDVYSLGGTLFYILTTIAPAKGKNVAEVLAAVSAGKISSPGDLSKQIPKPLDAICRKAMSREPGERYQRAIEMADDLERWLSDEPVTAYDEPLFVRAGRSLRKHRTGVIASLAVLATATISLGVANWMISGQNVKLEAARDLANSNKMQAVQQKNRAQENLTTAREIALSLLKTAEENLSGKPGKETLREEMMDRCYSMFDEIHQQSPDDRQTKIELANVARMSGNVKRLLDQDDESRVRLNRAADLLTEVLASGPQEDVLRDELAGVFRDIGTLEKSAGNPGAASDALNRAANEIAQLITLSPDDIDLRRTSGTINLELVGLFLNQLKLEDALAAAGRCASNYRALVTIDEPRRIDVVVYLLAVDRQIELLGQLNRPDETSRLFELADRIGQEVSARNPGRDIEYAHSRLQLRFAECLADHRRDIPLALEQIEKSIQRFAKLVDEFPRTAGYKYYLGDGWRVKALATAQQMDETGEDSALAVGNFEKAIAILELLAADSNKASYFDKLAQTYGELAQFYWQQDDNGLALEWIKKAIATGQESEKLAPLNLRIKQRLEELEKSLDEMSD